MTSIPSRTPGPRRPWVMALLAAPLAASLSLPMLAAAADPTAAGTPRTLRWDELVPKDWDPMKRFQDANMALLSDDSPQARELMRELREVWDNAPVVPALDGQRVRLPGYLVPLGDSRRGLREFLLVPYFGACIHTPPPPANQIVHVLKAGAAVSGLKSMDAVWVEGRLKAQRQTSEMGTSGYRIEAVAVERYVRPRQSP